MSLLDPEAQFTFGTQWGNVNRLAFGAFLCGMFGFCLVVGRQSWIRACFAGLLGALLGGVFNFVTDSVSDLVGLRIAKVAGMLGNLVSSAAWCVLVPAGISVAILLATGPTHQRLRRACVATVVAAIGSVAAQMIGTVVGGHHLAQTLVNGASGDASLQAFIPVWRAQAIAVGIAFGIAMAFADGKVRIGTLRLILGRNEAKDWSLDYEVSRIGSAEGIEIPVGRGTGVQPLHAVVVHQAGRFVIQAQQGAVLVNGSPVTQAELKHCDSIQLGSATLQFLSGNVMGATTYLGHSAPVPAAVSANSAPGVVGVLVDAAGGQYHLPPGQYLVGRDPDNSICLPQEPSVSRHHARLLVAQGSAQLADMGSTNGTRVNGQPVVQAELRAGDRIQFGCVDFTVVAL